MISSPSFYENRRLFLCQLPAVFVRSACRFYENTRIFYDFRLYYYEVRGGEAWIRARSPRARPGAVQTTKQNTIREGEEATNRSAFPDEKNTRPEPEDPLQVGKAGA